MDQSQAPLLDALVDYHAAKRYGFTPPGHRQGRGVDDRVLDVLGRQPFRDDVLASGGLDDRRMSNRYLKRAEDLMAEAGGGRAGWVSTRGRLASVNGPVMGRSGRHGGLLGGRGRPHTD